MKIALSLILVFISNGIFAEINFNHLIGKWLCEPYEAANENISMYVEYTIEVTRERIVDNQHKFNILDLPDKTWLKVSYIGPIKIDGNKITHTITDTKILSASRPDMVDSDELFKMFNLNGTASTVEILELTKSKMIKKSLTYGTQPKECHKQ